MYPAADLFRFKRGDHICVFYRDENTLAETLAAFLGEGLRRGERCFCAQKRATVARLEPALQRRGINLDREQARGAIELRFEDETYFPQGRFEPEAMMSMLEQAIEDAQRRGFTGLRTAGEMGWICDRAQDCDQLVGYEHIVDRVFPGKAAVGLCQYPAHRLDPQTLERVLQAHRVALQEQMNRSNHCCLTLRYGDYLADIVADRLRPGSFYYYVVQRLGAREIAGWGAADDFESARDRAAQLANQLAEEAQRERLG